MMKFLQCPFLLLVLLLCGVLPVHSQEGCAHVVDATASENSDGTWSFSATVSSTETGWDKYANEWRIEDSDGNVLGTRVLAHPHVTEQPFTRSLSGVEIPEEISVVSIVAQDSVLGYCGDSFELVLRETEAPTIATTMEPTNTTNTTGTFYNDTVVNVSSSEFTTTLVSMEKQHPPTLIIEESLEYTSNAVAPLLQPMSLFLGWGFLLLF